MFGCENRKPSGKSPWNGCRADQPARTALRFSHYSETADQKARRTRRFPELHWGSFVAAPNYSNHVRGYLLQPCRRGISATASGRPPGVPKKGNYIL